MGFFLKYIYMGKRLSIFPSLTLGLKRPVHRGFGWKDDFDRCQRCNLSGKKSNFVEL